MAKLEQLKRSILDQAVSENVDLITGRRRVRRQVQPVPRTLRLLIVVLSIGFTLAVAGLLRDRLSGVAAEARTAASDAGATAAEDAVGTRAARLGRSSEGSPQGITASSLGLTASALDPAASSLEGSVSSLDPTGAENGDGSSGGADADPSSAPSLDPGAAAGDRLYSAPSRIDPGILPLSVRRVILDPGHGGQSPGTVASDLLEKELTLDIALRLEQLLSAGGYEVSMTRDDDTHVELADRVELANRERGDLFVSIHVNWLGTNDARGIETFYLGPTDDPILEQLAHVENKGSGYSLTDFRTLLDGIYADARRDVSRDLAASIHHELVRHLRKVSPNLRDRGVKTAPFVVLIGTQMPAVLAEVSCLSSTEEIALLREPSYRQQIAEALHAGIASYARSLEPSPLTARSSATIAAGHRGN
ncbi:MAG TPA: N-acetylmuramoyl-L-alanine amidase [Thermoanaerobaculia bacterium]|nr:N-acetylmuramoyl-L-alanine amidase [Thermoanaerobaculia bacterium]